MDRIPTKIKWKINTFFKLYFKFWRYFLWKFTRYNHQIFYFFLFLLAFGSVGIIFHKFLELHSTISEKYFSYKFSFFIGFALSDPLFNISTNHALSSNFAEIKVNLKIYPNIFWSFAKFPITFIIVRDKRKKIVNQI